MTERLLESYLETFSRGFSLTDEQKEVVIDLLRSKDVVTILPTGSGKKLIYQHKATANKIGANHSR